MAGKFLPICLLLSPLLSACTDAALLQAKTADTTGINKIILSGSASMIHLTTNTEQPMLATLQSKPDGWLSGWFYNTCETNGTIKTQAQTLTIITQEQALNDWYECTPYVQVNLPRGVAVSINQPTFKADLQGQLANLNIRTRAADISLQGSVRIATIRGEALRTVLTLDENNETEKVDIAGRALDSSLYFPAGTKLSYRIDAKASSLDTKLPNTSGAKPEILISGDYIRTTIK